VTFLKAVGTQHAINQGGSLANQVAYLGAGIAAQLFEGFLEHRADQANVGQILIADVHRTDSEAIVSDGMSLAKRRDSTRSQPPGRPGSILYRSHDLRISLVQNR